jgi:hypothetical protein
MGKPTPKQIEKWKKIRAEGKRRFVFVRGVFGFGLITFALTIVTDYFLHFGPFASGSITVLKFVISLLLWLCAGYVWGSFMWSYLDRRLSE